MMNEAEGRLAIVCEAQSWIGTPYNSCQIVKGRRGGVDCGMFPLAVYADLGFIPKEFDPRPYSPQWHVHRDLEKYLEYTLRFSKEVLGPPARKPLGGDFILFKLGRVFAHGAIVLNWPMIIHATAYDGIMPEDVSKNTTGKRALMNVPQRFFSLWEASP